MKQTAVEWLVNKLNNDFGNNDFLISYANEISRAKEIEKEQIEDAYSEGDVNGIMNNRKMAEQYYKETFNT